MDRINSEKRTIDKMIRLYCRLNHAGKELCPECKALLDYATLRLNNCKYGMDKTICSECPQHCYRPDMRKQIKIVMRFSGSRMILYYPLELFLYFLRKWM